MVRGLLKVREMTANSSIHHLIRNFERALRNWKYFNGWKYEKALSNETIPKNETVMSLVSREWIGPTLLKLIRDSAEAASIEPREEIQCSNFASRFERWACEVSSDFDSTPQSPIQPQFVHRETMFLSEISDSCSSISNWCRLETTFWAFWIERRAASN